jgi:2-C-methyl-D-erythritol 4-phosphate cytidylyltransferase
MAIILAGGRGLRLNNRIPKQFLPLGNKPVIAWSLQLLNSLPEVDHVIIVIPAEFMKDAEQISARHAVGKLLKITAGGSTRQESALNALNAASFADNDIVLFHDAARPFIRQETVRKCIQVSREHGAAAVYVPVQDTVAEVLNDLVVSVPPRERMYYAQTPQAFRYSIIRRAHEESQKNGRAATDDVSLVLAAGLQVKMVEGDYSNFKITTDFDYQAACRMAETIYNQEARKP